MWEKSKKAAVIDDPAKEEHVLTRAAPREPR